MTLMIELPDELASRLASLMPAEERGRFAVSVLADAILAQERDAAECADAVEEALTDVQVGRTVSFEEEKARWQAQQSTLFSEVAAKQK